MSDAKEMSDIDMLDRINHLEDRVDEQALEIKFLEKEMAERDEATVAMFKAVVKDIEHLARFNRLS